MCALVCFDSFRRWRHTASTSSLNIGLVMGCCLTFLHFSLSLSPSPLLCSCIRKRSQIAGLCFMIFFFVFTLFFAVSCYFCFSRAFAKLFVLVFALPFLFTSHPHPHTPRRLLLFLVHYALPSHSVVWRNTFVQCQIKWIVCHWIRSNNEYVFNF